MRVNKNEFGFYPVGNHTHNASLGSVVTLTIPSNASGILIQAGTANVQYTLNGTTPTSTVGFRLSSTGNPTRIDLYPGAQIKLLSTTGNVNYQFFNSTLETNGTF